MKIRVLLAIVLAAGACRKSGSEADPTAVVQVKTAVVQVQPFEDKVGSIGTVSVHSGHLASLSAPAPARITTVYVSVGQKVSVGTPLIAFEQTPFISAARSAQASLAAAQQAYDRARRLSEAGIIPRATVEQAAKDLAQAEAAAVTARRMAQLAVVRAPISGVVTKLNASIGASADVNQPLVEVADLNALDIVFNVAPSDAAHMAPGAAVTLSAGETATGESLGVGRIISVSATVDSSTRSVEVRAQASPSARTLRIGETIFGQISIGIKPRAIVVPLAALVPEGEGFKVFVVNAENIALARPVTVGRRTDIVAEITSGLAGGERVVTEGAYGVEDSVKVSQAK
ncbi:MAG TPA: efflux RND transporter periplasmic adaptor subunit [Gemmatimonadaceae bacterium]|nr:efflux RND transporter periplasmic adaptor subunit [Gemmatimonadaceae bacterium]